MRRGERAGPFIDEDEAFRYNYLNTPAGKESLAAFGKMFRMKSVPYKELKYWLSNGQHAVTDIENSGNLNADEQNSLYRLIGKYINRYGGGYNPIPKDRKSVLESSELMLDLRDRLKYNHMPDMTLMERKKKSTKPKIKKKKGCGCK